MKILITGGKGQLGSEVAHQLSSAEYDFDAFDIDELDITNLKAVRKSVKDGKYTHIINCAAYTDVNNCESDGKAAYALNAIGARNLAIAAEECGAEIAHVSTDYVFSGQNQESPYTVYDIPSPVSAYGKTKLAGEGYIRDFSSKYYIVRTAWLYGRNGENFVSKIIKLASQRDEIKVVNDQVGSPTNAEDLAKSLIKLISTGEYGIYHCTGKGKCSWYDFAKRIVKLSGENCEVKPCTTDEFPTPARRPAYSVLDNSALAEIGIDVARDWEEALSDFISKKPEKVK